jgi:hypothetical protein
VQVRADRGGSRGKRTQDSMAKAEALGPTPLEVLLESMLAARAEGERAEAADCAKAAAPYVHSKLAPTSPPPAPVEFQTDYRVLTDAELEQFEKLFSKVLRRPSASEGAISANARTLSPAVWSGAQ